MIIGDKRITELNRQIAGLTALQELAGRLRRYDTSSTVAGIRKEWHSFKFC
jgi:hypothetical protein